MLFHFCATLLHFVFFFWVCVGMLHISFSEVSLRKMFAFFFLLCVGMLGRPVGFSEASLRKMFAFLFSFTYWYMLCLGFSEVLLRKMFAFLFPSFMHWYALYRLF